MSWGARSLRFFSRPSGAGQKAGLVYTGELMLARVFVFFALVVVMVGATAGMGLVVTEEATACQAYKTC